MSTNLDGLVANCFLVWICIGWPALWVFVALNVSRYGLVGWIRRGLERAKAGLPAERVTDHD